ncbi:MAG: histidinol-phosphate transaminase [Chloroflexaceae bacterium]|nr:histidinol-phosphate transaminase [Chloroflexaceae bacterium]
MQFKSWITDLPVYKPARLIGQQPKSVTKLSSNENALGPSPRALAAIQDALPGIARYPDASSMALRQKLASVAGLPVESIMCTNGSDEMVLLLCLAFLREQDEAVMAEGTFISYLLRTRGVGAQAVRVPLHAYTHDLPAMAQAITPRTRLLFVCNPNNPTATMVSHDDVQALLAQVPEHVLVVVDEAYREFVNRTDYPDLLPEIQRGRRNLIILRTFAKIYGLAGLRLGYAYGHPDVLSYLERMRPIFSVNTLSQVAGIAALDDHEHLERSRAHANVCRTYFQRRLDELHLSAIPSETNFIAFSVGDDMDVTSRLLDQGFAVTPLSGWGVPGCIRVTFGTTEQNNQFFATLSQIIQA